MTPTARSLAWLRKHGWTAQVVERWIAAAHVRKDFAGFADILAFRADVQGVLAVQATTGAHGAARLAKATALPDLATWLQAGNTFVVHAWAKQGPRGARKLWTLRELTLGDGSVPYAR